MTINVNQHNAANYQNRGHQDILLHPATLPNPVWIPSSRKWLLRSKTVPEDQMSFATSAAPLLELAGIPVYRFMLQTTARAML